jgi:hypothetical protein
MAKGLAVATGILGLSAVGALSLGLAGSAAATEPPAACLTPIGNTCAFTYAYTGAVQTFVVPPGVSRLTLDLYGAQGGSSGAQSGGMGGRTTATNVLVTPGQTLYLYVGGQAGWNGGGIAAPASANGGDATDVRVSGTSLSHRIVVAGGGGGAAADASGGAGGGSEGLNGADSSMRPGEAVGGGGGTQFQGGTGAPGWDYYSLPPGGDGKLGLGGNGAVSSSGFGGGAGGGGGYYGGGGGGAWDISLSSGGGGSAYSLYPGSTTFETGVRSGNGQITVSYSLCTPTGFHRDGTNLTARQIGGDLTGSLNAYGCDIGVYYGPGSTGNVSGATITNARYFGVVNDGRANLGVTGSTISNIGDSPFGGNQHGVGIFYTTEHALGTSTGAAGGTISGNILSAYQKGGITVRGAQASATITNNTVTGSGKVDYIAQNGIQISYGATARVTGNTVSGNWYTPPGTTSCGLLLFQAGGVKQNSNTLFANETNLCNVGRGGGQYTP